MGNNLGELMGRAINMENDLQKLETKVKVLEDALYKVIGIVDSMQERAQRTTHVDLANSIEEEKPKTKTAKKRSKAAA